MQRTQQPFLKKHRCDHVRSQGRDKWPRYLFNIKADAGHLVLPVCLSLPVIGASWLAYPSPAPNFSSLGLGYPSLYNPTILLCWSFFNPFDLPLALLASWFGSPLSLLPSPAPHMAQSSLAVSTLASHLPSSSPHMAQSNLAASTLASPRCSCL